MGERRTTNFFTRQDDARKSCRELIVLFLAAVAIIIIAVYGVVRLSWYLSMATTISVNYEYQQKIQAFSFWDPLTFIIVTVIVLAVIFIACAIKMSELKGGGAAVAKMLGGRLISWKSFDGAERQLMNIVEEMSIASGIPVPQTYVLDNEKGINAFAAGLRLDDAIVAVTRGTLDRLNRDELQGVIAHEFSHILHGDSRLNIQLIGLIYGIMAIGILGEEMLESHLGARISLLALITGFLLKIIGSGGSFAGRLIQCAISRQKELLADASAVKFTRNPQGLAAALKKIGGYVYGSQIKTAKAAQASHLFFSESGRHGILHNLLATHPPLTLRISLLDPSFNGKFAKKKDETPAFSFVHQDAPLSYATAPPFQDTGHIKVNPDKITSLVGNPLYGNLESGNALLAAIPPEIRQMVNTPAGALRVIIALLWVENCGEHYKQMTIISRYLDRQADCEEVLHLCNVLNALPASLRLPLLELVMPQMHTLSSMEKIKFLSFIDSLIEADSKITLFEFCVKWILQQYLLREREDVFGKTTFFRIYQVGYYILIILQALANNGHRDNPDAALLAFNDGVSRIPELAAKNPDFSYTENINYILVGTALKQLDGSSFKIKHAVIDACAYCAFSDKTITVAEAEILRVISLSLHCPLPPFIEKNTTNYLFKEESLV